MEDISKWHIMDVGTGRQALTFLNLGAKKVDHYDISSENVERVLKFRIRTGQQNQLSTECCDLVEKTLPSNKYDFIYLNGIVQHFSNVGIGIENCIKSLKKQGILWLYFYRSGTFDNFILYMIRNLIHDSNIAQNDHFLKEHYIASLLRYSDDVKKNYMTSIYIDGVFTKYAQLFKLSHYEKFLAERGLETISSSGVDPIGKDVEHYYARAATVLTLKKIDDNIDFSKLRYNLSPENDVNQLNKKMYVQPEIINNINLYTEIKNFLIKKNIPKSLTVLISLRLFEFLAIKTRDTNYNPMNRHKVLKQLLKTVLKTLKEEY